MAGRAVTDPLRRNANLVDSLSSAARHGGSALADAPALLRRVLEEDAWREFVTQREEHVVHRRFADFVTTPPLKGLGVTMELIERIVGTADPDLLVMLREAQKVGRGHRTDLEPQTESVASLTTGNADYLAARLERDHPKTYAAVKAGELSVNAAAVLAGIRPRRISVSLADPSSVARSLRRHMQPDQLAELIDQLRGE